MILNPPGLTAGSAQRPPHWPYLQAVDEALTGRGIPPGTVRADRTYTRHGDTMYIVLVWDISCTAGPGGLRFTWEEDTGCRGPHPTAHRATADLRGTGRCSRGGRTPRP